jgi:hypothetical protein
MLAGFLIPARISLSNVAASGGYRGVYSILFLWPNWRCLSWTTCMELLSSVLLGQQYTVYISRFILLSTTLCLYDHIILEALLSFSFSKPMPFPSFEHVSGQALHGECGLVTPYHGRDCFAGLACLARTVVSVRLRTSRHRFLFPEKGD